MSDVVSGGGVAFPDLHLKIEPEEVCLSTILIPIDQRMIRITCFCFFHMHYLTTTNKPNEIRDYGVSHWGSRLGHDNAIICL